MHSKTATSTRTPKHNSSTEPTEPPFHAGFDTGAVLDDVRAEFDKLVALFAYRDGDVEGVAWAANAEHREAFAVSAAEVVAHLGLLRELVASLESSAAAASQ